MTKLKLLLAGLFACISIAAHVALLTPIEAEATEQPCTTTLSVGGALASAVSSAANGAVICLNSGSWGSVLLDSITGRTGYVTIRSTTARGASIIPTISGGSKYIRLLNLTFPDGFDVRGCSQHIQVVNSAFVSGAASGLTFGDSSGCSPDVSDILVDGVDFPNVGRTLDDGRLYFSHANNAIVRNSTFTGINGPTNASDGIELVGNSSNITIGPNNLFSGIIQGLCGGAHCDGVQLYGAGTGIVIEGNWFTQTSTPIMAPDGSSGVIVRNNVFDVQANLNGTDVVEGLQFGSAINLLFEHNTVHGYRASFDSKDVGAAASVATVRNNVWSDTSISPALKTSNGNGCSGCSFTYNQSTGSSFDLSGCTGCTNSNNVFSTSPTYTGGTRPATWAGWRLTGGSAGISNASDGKNRGSLFFLGNSPTGNIR